MIVTLLIHITNQFSLFDHFICQLRVIIIGDVTQRERCSYNRQPGDLQDDVTVKEYVEKIFTVALLHILCTRARQTHGKKTNWLRKIRETHKNTRLYLSKILDLHWPAEKILYLPPLPCRHQETFKGHWRDQDLVYCCDEV